jgi:superfamily II DNA or RNA helicase
MGEIMELRWYQQSAIQKLRDKVISGLKRIVMVAPTGAGKTRIAGEIIMNAVKNDKRIAFVCNRIELVKQSVEAFEKLGIKCGVMQGMNTWDAGAQVVVCSVQTMIRRKFNTFELLIIDECHTTAGSKAFHKLFESHNNCLFIGLTATPWSKGMARPHKFLNDEPLWQDLVVAASIPMLIEQGYLVDCDIYAPGEPDLSGVRVVQGDYDKNALAAVSDRPKLVGDIVAHWMKLAGGEQTVCFAVNIAHSKHIVEEFKAQGVDARHVDGYMTDEERRPIIDAFRRGEFTVLSNCSMLAEGFDVPATSVCILARPTKSLIRYIQMCGRCLRIYDNLSEHYTLYRSNRDGIQGGNALEVGQLSGKYGCSGGGIEMWGSQETIFQALESDKRDIFNEKGACLSSERESRERPTQPRELFDRGNKKEELQCSSPCCDGLGGEQGQQPSSESQGWEQAEQQCRQPGMGYWHGEHEAWTRAWLVSPKKRGGSWKKQTDGGSGGGDKEGIAGLSPWIIDQTGTKVRSADDNNIGDKGWKVLGACFIAENPEEVDDLAGRLSYIHTGDEYLLVCHKDQPTGNAIRVLGVKPAKHRALILDHSGTVKRLGWPTDELPYDLDDGKPKEAKEAKEKLPKVCPSCFNVYKASLRKCPVCAFEPKPVPIAQEVEVGDLVQLSKKKTNFTMDDKQAIYSALLGWARSKGMKDGAAYHKFKSFIGHYPSNQLDKKVGPMVESVSKWLTHENIKWANSKPNFMKRAA